MKCPHCGIGQVQDSVEKAYFLGLPIPILALDGENYHNLCLSRYYLFHNDSHGASHFFEKTCLVRCWPLVVMELLSFVGCIGQILCVQQVCG